MCDSDNMNSNVDFENNGCDDCNTNCNAVCDAVMFNEKNLIIPEYVLEDDIPDIYHYFDYYNIASLKNVTFHPDTKIMYENPTTGEPEFYGYAKIEVEKWENNATSRGFYNSIINNKCKMVYDDPEYWDVMFDTKEELYLEHPEPLLHPLDEDVEEPRDEYDDECDDENDDECDDECDDVPINLPIDMPNNVQIEEPVEEQVDDDSEDEPEDEPEDEVEFNYEYYYKSYEPPQTRSRTKAKTNPGNDKMLTEIIVKKNKNYLKNNKRKKYKNVWIRRLRQKLVA